MKTTKKIVQITSGRGPAECCWVVAQVLKFLLEESRNKGFKATVLHREKGPENGTLYSAILELEGKDVNRYLSQWLGTVQWIGKSQYRTFHKRKNWFVGVREIELNTGNFSINQKEVKIEAIRSGGPGGQHVNKVCTAIRATHLPSGTSVVASDQRSQLQNKKLALERLELTLKIKQQEAAQQMAQSNWQQHNELVRGNPVKVFEGGNFKRKKEKKKHKMDRQKLKQQLRKEME